MSWTVSTWVAAALLALCGGQIAVHEGNWLSSTGYHVCTRNETRNVSFLVVQKVPYTVTKPCDGWLLWKTCTVTVTRIVSRTEYRTEWQQVPSCCDGYEQAGRYCVLPANRSGEFTAKPGFCPTAGGLYPGSKDCELDIDCLGWQKCCQLNGRSLCTDPASSSSYPENGGNRLNATVTVKTDYQQLEAESNGLLHHLRLLQSMVSGALQSKVRIYYLHSWPVHPYRAASSLLIHYGAPLSPHNVTWRLHLLLKHITEVSSVTVQDIDECAHAALRRCSGQAVCNNTMGSYQCSCRHGYVDVDPRNPGANCTADVNGSIPTEPPMTDHLTTNTIHTTASTSSRAPPPLQPTCPPPSIGSLWAMNVTGASFSVCWSSHLQTNQTYLVVVSKGSEMVVSKETNETMMEVRLLKPGVLYIVTVTPCTCGNQGTSLHVLVKTDARTLDATARITNVLFTADLHNTSSQAYKDLAGGIKEQIYQSLSPDIRAMVDLDQVRIEITGFSQGSVVVNFTIVSTPTQSHDITNVSNALLDSLVNSSTYSVDKNNTNINDFDECASGDHDCSQWANCTNTWASYSCACLDGFTDNNPARQGRTCQAIVTMESTTLSISPRTQITPRINTITTTVHKNVSGSTTIPTLTTTPTATAKTTVNTNNTLPTISTTTQTIPTTLIPTNNTSSTTSTIVQTTTTVSTPTNITIPIISTTTQTTHTTLRTTNNTFPTTSTTAQTSSTTLTPMNNTITTISKTAQTTVNASTTITDPIISTTLPISANDTSPTMNTVAATTIRTSMIANNAISIMTTTAPITMRASTSTLNATSSTMTTASAIISAPITTNNNHNNNVPLTNTVHPTTTSITNNTAPTTTLSLILTNPPTAPTTTSTITTTSTLMTSSITSTTSHAAVTTGTPMNTSTHALATTRNSTTLTSSITSLTSGTPETITTPATTSITPEPRTPAMRNLQGHLSVQCRDAAITVSIAKDFLLSANIQESALYLGLVRCGVNGDNGTHLQLTVAWNECDTTLVEKETHYTASVTLFNSMDAYISAGGEQKEPTLKLKVPIMCTFPKKMLISADFGSTGYNMIQENFTGSGLFQVKVQLMNGSVPLPQNYSLSPEEAVVVEVSLNTSSKLIKLVITSCWATGTPNPIDVNRYTFLENSCSQNRFTKVLANGNSSTSRVSVQIFSIVNLNVIYLHCQVQICLQIGADSCVPDCHQRAARSGKTVGRSFASIGPFFKSEEAGSLDDELSLLQIVGFSCLGVGLSLFFIIGFVCLFFYQRNRIGHYNFSIKPKEENFTYLVFNT